MRKGLLILTLWFTAWSALSEERPIVPANLGLIPLMMAKLSVDGDPAYYGTAVLFDVTDERYLFMTNAHLLSRDQEDEAVLRLHTPLNGYAGNTVTVVGQSPGDDLAVIAVRRTAGDQPVAVPPPLQAPSDEDLRRLIKALAREPKDPARPRSYGLLGYAGYDHVSRWPNLVLRSDPIVVAPSESASSLASTDGLGPKLPLREVAGCPAVFTESCFVVPIVSWGFSGSAFIVATNYGERDTSHVIAGIVSHYAPLSQWTYVIPISHARDVAGRIVSSPGKEPKKIDEDSAGWFRLHEDGSIEILVGELKGRSIARQTGSDDPRDYLTGAGMKVGGGHESVGGGHESVGGGHESVGGGHESVGGGHESVGGGSTRPTAIVKGPSGGIAFLGLWSRLIAAIQQPANWVMTNDPLGSVLRILPSFKGVQAFLAYRAGIELRDGQQATPVALLDGKPILSLQAFIAAYRSRLRSPGRGIGPEMADLPPLESPPKHLALVEAGPTGLSTMALIGRLWQPSELGERARAGKIRVDDLWSLGITVRDILPLMDQHAKAEGEIDLMIAAGDERSLAMIRRASVLEEEGRINVEAEYSRGERIHLATSRPWRQVGWRQYEYAGPVAVSWQESSTIEPTPRSEHAFISLRYEPDIRSWELKGIIAGSDDGTSRPADGYLTNERVGIMSLYLPLSAPLAP